MKHRLSSCGVQRHVFCLIMLCMTTALFSGCSHFSRNVDYEGETVVLIASEGDANYVLPSYHEQTGVRETIGETAATPVTERLEGASYLITDKMKILMGDDLTFGNINKPLFTVSISNYELCYSLAELGAGSVDELYNIYQDLPDADGNLPDGKCFVKLQGQLRFTQDRKGYGLQTWKVISADGAGVIHPMAVELAWHQVSADDSGQIVKPYAVPKETTYDFSGAVTYRFTIAYVLDTKDITGGEYNLYFSPGYALYGDFPLSEKDTAKAQVIELQ